MRNWVDLLVDLVDFILSNLFAKDIYSFSLVCRPQNTVVSTSPSRYSPCLMNYLRSKHLWEFFQYDGFFRIRLPDLEGAEIRCSKHGWLLMSRYDKGQFFFDPFNNRSVELPCQLRFHYTTMCFSHPPTSPECTIVGIRTVFTPPRIGVLKRGENQWENNEYDCELKCGENQRENNEFNWEDSFRVSQAAPVLHRGLIYFLDVKGNVATLDVSHHGEKLAWHMHSECLKQRRFRGKIKEHFLFKVDGEEALFAVFVVDNDRNVRVFRLLEPEMKWKSVNDIGNKVLYLSQASSFGCRAPLKSMANRIYFPKFHGGSAVFYSLRTRKYHSLNGVYSEKNAYGLQRLDFAAWIMPAPNQDLTAELTW